MKRMNADERGLGRQVDSHKRHERGTTGDSQFKAQKGGYNWR